MLRSIEVMGRMVAFTPLCNNPYLGPTHRYRGPVRTVTGGPDEAARGVRPA